MPLLTYEQTRPWADAIADAVEMKMMPPWFADPRYGHFANDPSLSDREIESLSQWAKSGAPAGEARDAPPPRIWAAGWNIPQPDLIVRMPKPVQIPAKGEVEYTYEIVPTRFAEDRWVQTS
ncbi:MAG TPA: thiol-disulfide isomerase, partial [Candidatus Sulfotelmatobacter sp.]|nr:thiol-disulfide isomerase [Candidatus Sulfotelmatobacter sp.]